MSEETKLIWEDPAPDWLRRHKLVTREVAKNIPALGVVSDDEEVDFGGVTPAVKLFSPYSGWDWYIIEWDALSGLCFGLVHGLAQEFGSFHLNDLARLTLPGNIPLVEREVNWPGQTVRELQEIWHRHFPAEAPYY